MKWIHEIFSHSVLTDFRSTNSRDPSRDSEKDDKRVLSELRTSVLESFNVEEDILPEEYLEWVSTCVSNKFLASAISVYRNIVGIW